MSRSRGKIRKKKQFRRLMRRGGACSLCAPMLRHPAGTTNVSSFTCPGGHEIAFTPSLEAYDTLARCISVPLSTCHDGYRISCGGEVKYERECGCDGQHADFQVVFTTTTGLDSSVERNFDFMEARSKRVASQIEQNLNGSFSNVEARAQKAMTGAGNPFQNVGPQARMSVAEARAAFGAGFDEMVKTGRVGANEIGKSLAGGVAGGVAKGTRDAQQLLGAHLKAMKIAMREAERDIGSGSLNPFARAALSRVVPGGFLTTSVVNELSKFNSEAARTQAMLKAVDPEFAIFLRQFKS